MKTYGDLLRWLAAGNILLREGLGIHVYRDRLHGQLPIAVINGRAVDLLQKMGYVEQNKVGRIFLVAESRVSLPAILNRDFVVREFPSL